jgi:very-short-patch-repair endonuclease
LIAGHRVDAVWREAGLIVEIDGVGTHHTPVAFDRDRASSAELTTAGWKVLRFAAARLKYRPLTVLARIVEGLHQPEVESRRSPGGDARGPGESPRHE